MNFFAYIGVREKFWDVTKKRMGVRIKKSF
jgi:hypothetical protein